MDDPSEVDKEEFDKKTNEFEQRRQKLSIGFQKLADYLHKAGAFDEREEARAAITLDANRRKDFLGPDGIVPDDGSLNPEHEVDGLLALIEGRQFFFQVPVASNVTGDISIQFVRKQLEQLSLSNLQATITSDFSMLNDFQVEGPFNQELHNETGLQSPKNWIWVEGQIHGKNYHRVKLFVETLCQEIQGMLLALNFAKFHTNNLIPPPAMVIGSGKTYNSGSYTNSVSANCAFSIKTDSQLHPEGDLDKRQEISGDLARRIRLFERLFKSETPRAQEIRQALRMYLRARAAWSEGEKAMFLATLLEGLLLDRRKDDLSARLQDAVAYWIGTTSENRDDHRRTIRNLYNARSEFVHNGTLNPQKFNSEEVFNLAKEVIRKEILHV
jgi:hypothetical protein